MVDFVLAMLAGTGAFFRSRSDLDGTQAQTATTVIEFVGPVVLGAAATILVKLEECADRCQARHRDGLAPGRFPLVLALEISQGRGRPRITPEIREPSCVWRKKTLVGVHPKSMANC